MFFNINNIFLFLLDLMNIVIEKFCLVRIYVSVIYVESFLVCIWVCIVINKCIILIKNCFSVIFVGNGFLVYLILEFIKYFILMFDCLSVISV